MSTIELTETEELIDNPLKPNEKRIPGFSRYAVNTEGEIRNIMLDKQMLLSSERPKFQLIDDEGKRKWFFPTPEFISDLFKPAPVEKTTEEKFTEEILPKTSSIIDPRLLESSGSVESPAAVSIKPAKGTKKGLSDQDIRDLRNGIANNSLTFKTASEKYGIALEHARRIYKRQYYPNVV